MALVAGLALFTAFVRANGQQKVAVRVSSRLLNNGDRITFIVNSYGVAVRGPFAHTYTAIAKDGVIDFSFLIERERAFLSVQFGKAEMKDLRTLPVRRGDQVDVEIQHGHVAFKGNNTVVLALQEELNDLADSITSRGVADTNRIMGAIRQLQILDTVLVCQLLRIRLREDLIGVKEYEQLRADCYIKNELSRKMVLDYSVDRGDTNTIHRLNCAMIDYLPTRQEYFRQAGLELPHDLRKSPNYARLVYRSYLIDTLLMSGKSRDVVQEYRYFLNKFDRQTAHEIVTQMLFDYRFSNDIGYQSLLDTAVSILAGTSFEGYARSMRQSLKSGEAGYNFSLVDTSGRLVTLAKLRGYVVVLDFWFTGCGNCIQLHPYMDRVEERLKNRKVVFVTVNTDLSRAMWINSVKTGKYTSPSSINLNTDGKGLDHPLLKYYSIDGFPTILIFDHTGRKARNVTDPRSDNGLDIVNLLTHLTEM